MKQRQIFIYYIIYVYQCLFIIGLIKMDIQQQNNLSELRKETEIEQESPIQKPDLFQELFIQQIEEVSLISQETYKQPKSQSNKRLMKIKDFRKMLNSSSSNERLIPSQMKYQSSRQNSQRDQHVFQTQNSLDSESFRKSFKKRYDESFSVQNTIRDSSSSFSQKSQRSYANILPSFYKEEDQMIEEKKIGCNCKRSKCLKLYCQCFQKKIFCNEHCNCHDCGNHSQNVAQHKQAIIQALARNAHGFNQQETKKQNPEQKTFSLGFQIEQVKKGCKCRKTHCLKKYCQCYQGGSPCGLFCKCQECLNTVFSHSHSNTQLHKPQIQMKKYF